MKPLYTFAAVLLLFSFHDVASQNRCNARGAGDSFVCVCNAASCDTVEPIPPLSKGNYADYTSVKTSSRLKLGINKTAASTSASIVLEVNKTKTRQTIIGFGGAFTDAAGVNIASLPQAAQDKLIEAYFSKNGIEYNIGRIPMASCDFSTRVYSYDDVEGDLQLTHFALASEDLKLKIPYIRQALNLTEGKLRLFGSPWSAPYWMKTEHNMTGNGSLIGQPGGPYFKAWADYFVKFVQAYQKQGVPIWGLTLQNEPTDGEVYKFSFQAMGWTPEMQRDFIKVDLGPALHSNGLQNIQLMILDDQRLFLPYWAKVVYSDPDALKYISGVAIHWYLDDFVPINVLDFTHDMQPDKFIFGTEACVGDRPWEQKVSLGDWGRGEMYAHDIIGDLNHWVTGWTDWNMALNLEGGPNWVKNFVDSPIIVNASSGEFYKQPMFYVLAHFSKFLIPGSKHISVELHGADAGIEYTAFMRPDGILAMVLLNRASTGVELSIHDPDVGYINIDFSGHSIKTVLWRSS